MLFRWGLINLIHITIGLRLSLRTWSPCVSWASLLCLQWYAKLSHQFWKFWIHQWNLVTLKAPDTVKSKVLSGKQYVLNLIEYYHQTKNDLYIASSLLPEVQCYNSPVGCTSCSNFPTWTGTSIACYWLYPSSITSHPGSLNGRFISSLDSGWLFGLVKMKCTHKQLPGWRNQSLPQWLINRNKHSCLLAGVFSLSHLFVGTVASVLTHTCRWTPKSMGYYRVWVLAELIPGPFFWVI